QTKLNGKVIAIGSKANPAGGFPIQFLVQNTKELFIKAGMFGKVELIASNEEEGIYIPAAILQGGEKKPSVYLIKNNQAVLTPIVIKKRVQDQVLIERGVSVGDEVVSKGFINLFDGANVLIKN